MPLVVVVVLDGARGADARVVYQDVEAGLRGQRAGGLGDGGTDGGVVGHVRDDRVQVVGRAGLGLGAVEHGDAGAAGGEQPGGGQADAGGTAGDQGGQPGEFG